MKWLAVGLGFGLMFAYLMMLKSQEDWFNEDWTPFNGKREIVIDEYWADDLKVRIFYNREELDVYADLNEWEDGRVYVTIITSDAPKSEVERKIEGTWVDAGPAIVKVIEGTDQVVSITYIKE